MGLERQLFGWDGGWDDIDEGVYIFYDCTLVVPIGDHPIGAHFETIMFDVQNSQLALQNDGEESVFKLLVTAVE